MVGRVVVHKINPSNGSFYRATFWNPDKYVCHNNQVMYTPNTREVQFPYMLMVSSFTSVNSQNETEFKVVNCHAPMVISEKVAYWNAVAIGDVNKFEEHLHDYKCLFDDEFPDRVPLETLTFVSFECDTKPDGSLWRSSLDAVIAAKQHQAEVTVVPTTVTLTTGENSGDNYHNIRPSDHFIVVADVQFA